MMDSIGPIRVLVLETEPQIIANARAALEGDNRLVLVGAVNDQASLLDKLGSTYAHVAVIDIAGLHGDVGPAVHEILAHAPECCVIVTGSNVAPGVVSRAVTAGARGFLLKPYQPEDFVSTIRDAYVNFQELRRLQRIERVPGTTSRPGAVIAVYSPKGGVGCTTIATNLAVALARRSGKSTVALVDLDLQFGDIGIALDLKSANSLADLLNHVDSIDQQLVDEVFVKHASGVRALLAPDNLASVPSIDPDRVARVVDQLRPHFQYIVCDLWSSLEDLTLATLRMADRVILVTDGEIRLEHFNNSDGFSQVNYLSAFARHVWLSGPAVDKLTLDGPTVKIIENNIGRAFVQQQVMQTVQMPIQFPAPAAAPPPPPGA